MSFYIALFVFAVTLPILGFLFICVVLTGKAHGGPSAVWSALFGKEPL